MEGVNITPETKAQLRSSEKGSLRWYRITYYYGMASLFTVSFSRLIKLETRKGITFNQRGGEYRLKILVYYFNGELISTLL